MFLTLCPCIPCTRIKWNCPQMKRNQLIYTYIHMYNIYYTCVTQCYTYMYVGKCMCINIIIITIIMLMHDIHWYTYPAKIVPLQILEWTPEWFIMQRSEGKPCLGAPGSPNQTTRNGHGRFSLLVKNPCIRLIRHGWNWGNHHKRGYLGTPLLTIIPVTSMRLLYFIQTYSHIQ